MKFLLAKSAGRKRKNLREVLFLKARPFAVKSAVATLKAANRKKKPRGFVNFVKVVIKNVHSF